MAQNRIRGVIRRPPIVYSYTFSKLTGKEVYFKWENLWKGGPFKVRNLVKIVLFEPSLEKGRSCNRILEIMPDVNLLDRIIEKGLSPTGRIVRFGVLLKDVPGRSRIG